ncbi:MAG: helix-turn-helix transcriptional regulator [Lachnospiraceae bacterium]|nr:helix-turn-helix transcriptional regulator [Lachnospiraceae bacterium]
MKKGNDDYRNIDLKRTGANLRQLIAEKGYDVKSIQESLHLSCPQPIYRWFKGQVLPSVDHLFMLSILLGVHMEELLIEETVEARQELITDVETRQDHNFLKRLLMLLPFFRTNSPMKNKRI